MSFVSRSICSRIVRTNSARATGSGSSSSSNSTKPASEKIGVRSSCDAFAMNSLRALSRRREPLLHLVERARELADLVGRVDRDRRVEVAPGDLLRRLLEPAQALRVRARREPAGRERREQRDQSGDHDLAPDEGDAVVDVRESGGEDGDPGGLVVDEERDRRLARELVADALDRARRTPGGCDRGRRRRIIGQGRRPFLPGVGDDEGRLGPVGSVADPEHGDPGVRAGADALDQVPELPLAQV